MKNLLIAVFTLVLTIAPVQKTQAAVAGVMALTGAGAAGSVAIAGLASPLVGGAVVGATAAVTSSGANEDHLAIGFVVGLYLGGLLGLVLLDEQTGDMAFEQLSPAAAAKLNLEQADVAVFNEEIEEANILLEEVTSELSANSTLEESRAIWQDMQDFVSPETFKVMQALATQK